MNLNKEDIWKEVLDEELSAMITGINYFLINRITQQPNLNIFPLEQNIFRAFKEISFNECKYVLLGQDPYHNKYKDVPSACGLSFVTENGYSNPSLRILCESLKIKPDGSIFKELMLKNKVLLLNAALTVEEGKPNSHREIWLEFTKTLIQNIDNSKEDITFILLGKDAQGFSHLIKNNNIIKGPHPASYLYTGKTDYSTLTNVWKLLNIIT